MSGTVEEEKLLLCIKEHKNEDVVKLVRVGGRDLVRYTTKEGTPILNEAILCNNTPAVKLLLERGADPCSTDKRGQTALHAAARVDNVLLLLDLIKTSSIHIQDLDGNTPLHTAVRYSCTEVVKWLVFSGADPLALNKKQVACRALTKKNQIIQLLRDFNPNRPAVRYARLETSKEFTSEGLPFSIRLAAQSSGSPCFAFTCSFINSMAPDKLRLLDLKDNDEGWGPAVEYLCTQEADVALTFPLGDLPPPMCEVVLRVLDTRNDTTFHVKVHVSQDLSTSKQETIMDDVVVVARGDVTMRLNAGGLLQLVCQPLKQSFNLKKGHSSVKSVLDDRVQLAIADTEMQITGDLEMELSPPVKEPVALYDAPTTHNTEIESQGNYVTLYTREQSNDPRSLTIQLPLPDQYCGGPITVYVRNQSQDSGIGDEVDSRLLVGGGYYARNQSNSSVASDTDDESDLERESGLWQKGETVSPQSTAKTVTLPAAPNKTMTLVETAPKPVHESRQKAAVARQYKKRRHKKCLFFVAARSLESWRECYEVLVVATSPSHQAAEFTRHLIDRYCLLHVSGNFLTKTSTQFRLTVLGNLLVYSGESEATVTFNQGVRQNDMTNCAHFVLRRSSKLASGEGRIGIHQKMKKARKGSPTSKCKGELHFNLNLVEQVWRLDGVTCEELSFPFSDQLLLNLVDILQTSESASLGIRLGLSASHVDSIMYNHYLPTPNLKCFEMLRRVRDRSESAVKFGHNLVAALQGMDWNMQREWLLDQLTDWPRRAEIV